MKPLFELMGKNITLVGGNGDGQTTKVANQIIVALTIEAVAEALLFASKAGADPAKVRQALMGGFAISRILEVHGERMVKRTFDPGFRIELHQKDLNLALAGRARPRHQPAGHGGLPSSCSTPARRTAAGLGSFGDGAGAGAAERISRSGRSRHNVGSLGPGAAIGDAGRRTVKPAIATAGLKSLYPRRPGRRAGEGW